MYRRVSPTIGEIVYGTVSSKITLMIFSRTSKRKVTLALKCMLTINSVPNNFLMDSPIKDA